MPILWIYNQSPGEGKFWAAIGGNLADGKDSGPPSHEVDKYTPKTTFYTHFTPQSVDLSRENKNSSPAAGPKQEKNSSIV